MDRKAGVQGMTRRRDLERAKEYLRRRGYLAPVPRLVKQVGPESERAKVIEFTIPRSIRK